MKDKYYNHYTKEEIRIGYVSMKKELETAPEWLCVLFDRVWKDFEDGKFKYDGATGVPERFKKTVFEVASIIHDWLNANGIVSYVADALMLDIMKVLKYSKSMIFQRWVLTRLTFINILRHKYYLKDYKGKYPIELLCKI